jgi:L-ascorbate metabolism protein UlaG (beta-lactamase superfamily)
MKNLWLLSLAALSSCATVRAPSSPLTVTWFGVAGLRLTDGVHTVVVDPYFSHPSDPLHHAESDPEAVARLTPASVDAVLVGHVHVDHALDAPAVAKRTGAVLLGPRALIEQARTQGVPEAQLRLIKGGEDLAFDTFSVRVVPSLHSQTGLANGDDVDTFAYLIRLGSRQVLVFDTANFIEKEVEGLRPDVAIIATGLRARVHDYSCRLMRALGAPQVVLPTHFDDWLAPPGTALTQAAAADLRRFEAELHACAPATQVIVPTAFVPLPL